MSYREASNQSLPSSSSPGQQYREQYYGFEQQNHEVAQEGNESVRHFKNDSDSHMGLQIRASPRPPSSSIQNEFSPVSSAHMTPKGILGDTAGREATAEIRDRVSKQYPIFVQQVLNEGFLLPIFTFLPGQSEIHWSKFLCFPLNSKNSKNVKYDLALGTCVPVFKCQWCKKSFMKPSALGGHLSKCSKKGSVPADETPSERRSICDSSPAEKRSAEKQKNAPKMHRKYISKRRTVLKKQTDESC